MIVDRWQTRRIYLNLLTKMKIKHNMNKVNVTQVQNKKHNFLYIQNHK